MMTMRWPWETREDTVIVLLDKVLEATEQARAEHDEELGKLRLRLEELTDGRHTPH